MVRNQHRGGFTLIELLVVIVVIGVLATFVAPNVLRHIGTSKVSATRAQLEMLTAALDSYRLDNGTYPTTEQGLESLWREPLAEPRPTNWSGPYLRKKVPVDPWRRPYSYRSPGTLSNMGFDLLSLGADGKEGGSDDDTDIKAWE